MYRGEVNISQDQLAALLKAAESLQIKGLSDSRGGGGGNNNSTNTPSQAHKSDVKQHIPVPPKVINSLTICPIDYLTNCRISLSTSNFRSNRLQA